jgi:catalase (peroxidase I)
MIALGTTLAVKVCSGPLIAFKGGRIDAPGPGDFGVPEPDTDISTTLERFALAGFSQTEAIQLTACGHTVGN